MDNDNRVVVLIDMDCFYCQVEEKLDPTLKGKPIAVVQYNPWKGGGIIAVNYVARARGVTRHMRGDEAKEKCPEIELPSVPCQRGKADITKYRDAGKEVAQVLQGFTPLLERASIDEAYLDITLSVQERMKSTSVHSVTGADVPNTYALGYSSMEEFTKDVCECRNESIEFDLEHARQLLIGALIVSEIRAAVYNETGYRCSAGIAHNKILAKLVCGMNKPNKQTILPKHSVNVLYRDLSLKKVKHLGGKFGDNVCELLKISKMIEIQRFTEKELQAKFDDKNGSWLYNIARGADSEPVQAKFNPKSIGCCKQFKGKNALIDLESLKKWLRDLGEEIEDRLEKDGLENNRTPKQMVVSFSCQLNDGKDVSSSRSYNFVHDNVLNGDFFSAKALELVMDSMECTKPKDNEENRKLKTPIKFLGISVGKFEDNVDSKKIKKIQDYFGAGLSIIPNTNTKANLKSLDPDLQKEGGNESNLLKARKKLIDKETIFEKFFKVMDNNNKDNDNITIVKNKEEKICNLVNIEHTTVSSNLDKQESFFQRFLSAGLDRNVKNESEKLLPDISHSEASSILKVSEKPIHPTTPVCKVVEGKDEDTTDSNYSSSTINNEINKSILLFDDAPEGSSRVSNMRKMLSTSIKLDNGDDDDEESVSIEGGNQNVDIALQINDENKCFDNTIDNCNKKDSNEIPNSPIDTYICLECNNKFPITLVDTHLDFHLALKLREEERTERRKERDLKSVKPVIADVNKVSSCSIEDRENVKPESTKPISNFFKKLSENVPLESCTECGKKVPVEMFLEHLDFHEAQKLHRELNKKTVDTSVVATCSKRKRKKMSPDKSKKPCRSIDSFFR